MTLQSVSQLTPEQRRVECAKLCGYKGTFNGVIVSPDFDSILSSCMEFKTVLQTPEQRHDFISNLMRVAASTNSSHWDCAFATANQRVSAFLMTMLPTSTEAKV